MDKRYDPKKIEAKWYKRWVDGGLFHSDSTRGGNPYCIVIPPPNVTGILHMGHALNCTIQDILIRWHRMQGRNVVWLPGTDHAGIATQNVVERSLKEEGKSREDLGREAFIKRVWKWREEYGSTIINQLKKMGCSCDWDRERFTMDKGLSEAVSEVFVRLYEKGLVYRANYIVNWCSRCHTALSDEESEHRETKGKLYYIRYRTENRDSQKDETGSGYIVVATTRPETLLGDVAVAVNPKDERYADLEKKKIILPILERELTVIRDDFVDPKFGTGIVKVTPAHDINDFGMGQRHGLTPIIVMNGDGTMNEQAGKYHGMDRFECRRQILKDLNEAGLIEKIEDHVNAVGHCYRCDTVVEPRLSPQWFVKMKPLAQPAIEAVKSGKVKFVPGRWENVYLEWMENIRDWCISRQIWWGHQIPVFYCDTCGHQWAARTQPSKCPKCAKSNIRQDRDVLDTWFSSWLWPFSTFGWPGKSDDLKFYYPTHDLVTASEIIFFWVARMIMAGLEFAGDIPFRTVYIHGTVRDDRGRKMSKSLGNSINPLSIIDEFSADALRYSLMMITATGQDIYVSNEKFEIGRNFGTKLWNAARFILMHSGDDKAESFMDAPLEFDSLSADDKHILSRLQQATDGCSEALEKYRFNDAALTLYEFVWHQFCDWYVEYAKDIFYGNDEKRKKQILAVMHRVFSASLRLLHPMMPFITEELWSEMGYAGEKGGFISSAGWPGEETGLPSELGASLDAVEYVDNKHELVRVGRALRSDYGVAPSATVNYMIKPCDEVSEKQLRDDEKSIKSLLRAKDLVIDKNLTTDKAVPGGVTRLGTIFMPLEGLIDVEAEMKRLKTHLSKVEGDLGRVTVKLENVGFISKAPADVIRKQEQKKRELSEERNKLKSLIETLSGV